jgi:hypothetical protein
MPDKPTFGRYPEIPFEQMTPEQQEAYRSLIETRGSLLGPNKIWVHNPKLDEGRGTARRPFPAGQLLPYRTRARNRRLHHQQQMAFGLPDQRTRAARQGSRSASR